MPQGNLPAEARKIFSAAEAAAKKSTCKDREDKDACVAKIAWSAVKKKFKKVGDKWVRKEALTQFSMAIVKAPFDNETGEMKWRAVASDTNEDTYKDEMSLELYSDFMQRIESEERPPEPFCSDFWAGGVPYLSVSHYPDLNGNGVPGDVGKVFMDGDKLKGLGTFSDTPLGRACWKSVRKDLLSEERAEASDKVRISIAFLDWEHEHKKTGFVFERSEEGSMCPECFEELINSIVSDEEPEGKKFLKGHLVHLAMTRVPVNRRTLMEVDKSMAEEIKTQVEDAASIVGEDEAEKLAELAAEDTLKSESLVIKAKSKKEEEDEDEKPKKEHKKEKKSTTGNEVAMLLEEIKSLVSPSEDILEAEPHPLDEAVANLKSVYDEALEADFSPEEALQLIQEPFERLGNLVRESVTNPEVSGEPQSEGSETELVKALSKIVDRLDNMDQQMGLLQSQMATGSQAVVGDGVPARRNIQPTQAMQQSNLFMKPASEIQSETPKLRAIVNKSVGAT